ncbi:amino acid transporter [Herbaspirillum sp. LeCh32-8]|uniref:LysE/ArgO family amino acid transporter n=1 Tax=Herbaspirillum sp. LeCh32-8 TaxID=2821356 RepID=UPI001AE82A6C|nr:LysE/ArgO family amino acid transporter [Herbaspirillum sp. LeCh32-8]MBP0597773.1 amino acid transporter [Herbaspirillum sp. LeCh32-8]
MNPSVFLSGMAMGLSLIMPIGAQNAFVLKQGLRNEYIFTVCLMCALSDAVLIVAGVSGFARVAAWLPWAEPVMRYGGAAFLAWYGFRSLRAALRSDAALRAHAEADSERAPFGRIALACLALTWLNPHVYLDTMVLLGSVSSQFGEQRAAFAAGAASGSFLFFFSLGYAARWLRPVFARPLAWRVLDGVIVVVMWSIAWRLVTGA